MNPLPAEHFRASPLVRITYPHRDPLDVIRVDYANPQVQTGSFFLYQTSDYNGRKVVTFNRKEELEELILEAITEWNEAANEPRIWQTTRDARIEAAQSLRKDFARVRGL